MFADNILGESARLWRLFLLIGTMASGATLAAEDTFSCVPIRGGFSSSDAAYLDQIISNQMAIPSPPAPVVSSPSATDNFYIVQKGDTLYAIMRKSGVPIKNLIVLNQLPSANSLKEGQSLKLFDRFNTAQPLKQPEKQVVPNTNTGSSETAVDRYVVRVGDTLYAISRQTGVSIERLVSLNQLDAANSINAGQQLRLR